MPDYSLIDRNLEKFFHKPGKFSLESLNCLIENTYMQPRQLYILASLSLFSLKGLALDTFKQAQLNRLTAKLSRLAQEAMAGDPASKHKLGTLLISGEEGVQKNKERGFELIKDAAKAGYGDSMYFLIMKDIYARTSTPGVEDYKPFLDRLLQAAKQKSQNAQIQVASILLHEGDLEGAEYWLRPLANKGIAIAQWHLAMVYTVMLKKEHYLLVKYATTHKRRMN